MVGLSSKLLFLYGPRSHKEPKEQSEGAPRVLASQKWRSWTPRNLRLGLVLGLVQNLRTPF
jgi:hypothetical protein